MKKNEIFIVKKNLVLDDGDVPCGATIEMQEYNKDLNKYEVSITPYIKNGKRKSIKLFVEKDFILSNGER